MPGSVLVATNLSSSADEALRQGDALAHDRGAHLTVCHILPDFSEVRLLFPQYAGFDPEVLAELQLRARAAVILRVTAVIGRQLPAEDVLIEICSPHQGIRDAINRTGASTVALGPGPTASRVAHNAVWSVLVARPAPAGGGVLGATDFSDPALPALEAAVRESTRRGVRLQLLHAVHFDASAFAMPGAMMIRTMLADTVAALEENARQRLGESLAHFHATGDCLVTHGPAAICIVDAAAALPAALVVVGTHGRSGLSRWVLDSVAERVMHVAPCSVLVVPLAREARQAAVAAI